MRFNDKAAVEAAAARKSAVTIKTRFTVAMKKKIKKKIKKKKI